MLRTHLLTQDGLTSGEGIDSLRPPKEGARVWVELVAPTEEENRALNRTLGIHELALEDAQRVGHPPKLEDFGDHLFLIAHTPDRDEEESTRKICIFLSKFWIVTILRAPLERLDEVLTRVRRDPARFLTPPAVLAHAILDHMTDGFESLFETLRDELEEIEEAIEANPHPEQMSRILDMRRQVSFLTRVVRGQRDVAQSLARSGHAMIPKKIEPYLRDVYDHLVRTYENLESARDGLGAVRDSYLSAVNNRLSEVMRVLTVIATVMMPLSLIAGIYGMNFDVMPGAKVEGGFWWLLVLMALLAGAMLLWFRRKRWL